MLVESSTVKIFDFQYHHINTIHILSKSSWLNVSLSRAVFYLYKYYVLIIETIVSDICWDIYKEAVKVSYCVSELKIFAVL